MSNIQASTVPLELSTNNSSWWTLVCLENYTVPLTANVVETETFCGIATGVGAIKHAVSGAAVCETAPTVSQVTYEQMLNWFKNKTTLYYRSQSPSSGSIGSTFFVSGQCFVSALELQAPSASDVIKFTFTLTGNGNLF